MLTATYMDLIMLIGFGWMLGVTTMTIKHYLNKRARGDV